MAAIANKLLQQVFKTSATQEGMRRKLFCSFCSVCAGMVPHPPKLWDLRRKEYADFVHPKMDLLWVVRLLEASQARMHPALDRAEKHDG